MSKRKLTSEEAVANFLRFAEADDDCEDEPGLAGDDLDEIYDDDDDDDDRNAADEDSGDDDEDEVEHKSSSDDDQPQLNLNRAIDRHEKCCHIIVWSTQSTNRLTQIVLIHMILALLMMKNMKQS